MPRFDPPEADWTDEFEWTRYRGPQPYPCPADWVLDLVEGDGIIWYRFPGIGEGLEMDDDVREVFEPDYEEYDDARGETAILSKEIVEDNPRKRESKLEHELSIDGETIFRRVEPDDEDLFATVAEALARYSNGQELEDVAPSTGRLPEDLREQQETERRQAENQSLTQFTERGSR